MTQRSMGEEEQERVKAKGKEKKERKEKLKVVKDPERVRTPIAPRLSHS